MQLKLKKTRPISQFFCGSFFASNSKKTPILVFGQVASLGHTVGSETTAIAEREVIQYK